MSSFGIFNSLNVQSHLSCLALSLIHIVLLSLSPSLPSLIQKRNGFHGHVFHTAFQPILRFPFLGDTLAHFIDFLLRHPYILDHVRRALSPFLDNFIPFYSRIFGSQLLKKAVGERYMLDFLQQYIGELSRSPRNIECWLRLFQVREMRK